MSSRSTGRTLLLAICGGTIANQLALTPLLWEWEGPYSETVKNFLGITLAENFSAQKEIIPAVVEVVVNYLMIAGLAMTLRGRGTTAPMAVPAHQWGVAGTPNTMPAPGSSPPPPPPPGF